MHYNKPLFTQKPSKVELMEKACEDAKITHKFKKEYILRDKYFKYIESYLPKTEHLLFRYIAKYEDKNSEILNSPYILKQCQFRKDNEDGDIVFKCTNIKKEELKKDMKSIPLPGDKEEIASFQPLQVVLLLIIRYYILTKQPEKTKIMYKYYGYSIYWKYFSTYWKDRVYRPDVMVYTINNMSYRYIIKKMGSVKSFISYSIQNRYEYYIEEVVDCTDEDIRYILSACCTDINNKLKEIYGVYKENISNNNMLFDGSAMYDDNTQREDTSNTAAIEVLSREFTSDFFSNAIDKNIVKSCAKKEKDVSEKELRVALEYVRENATPEEMHEFFSSLILIYVHLDNPRATIDSVRSILFIASMMDMIKKGNSTDRNIVKIRELMDSWLMRGSHTFQVTKRDGTKISYRKAVFMYFVLSVAKPK